MVLTALDVPKRVQPFLSNCLLIMLLCFKATIYLMRVIFFLYLCLVCLLFDKGVFAFNDGLLLLFANITQFLLSLIVDLFLLPQFFFLLCFFLNCTIHFYENSTNGELSLITCLVPLCFCIKGYKSFHGYILLLTAEFVPMPVMDCSVCPPP